MKHDIALDISVKETAICVVDEQSKVLAEKKCLQILYALPDSFRRNSSWLKRSGWKQAFYFLACSQALRTGFYKEVYLKEQGCTFK